MQYFGMNGFGKAIALLNNAVRANTVELLELIKGYTSINLILLF